MPTRLPVTLPVTLPIKLPLKVVAVIMPEALTFVVVNLVALNTSTPLIL